MLYIIDHETFTQLTGMRIKWSCNPQCSRFKRRADSDEQTEDSYTNYERDVYLTESTKDYMREQHDTKVEQPKRKLRQIFWCCFQTKNYTGDKYHIPWSESQSSSDRIEGGVSKNKSRTKTQDGINQTIEKDMNICAQFFEEIRLRLFWRPTKQYKPNVDKYHVGDDEEGEIKYAASSYESAAVGDAPW